MPLPIALIPALIAGGTLVPHATGGLIVTSTGGYVAGTFLSASTLSGLIGGGLFSGGLGLGVLGTLGLSSIIGSTGFFGTGFGASGLTGVAISAGLISTTPIWMPTITVVGGLSVFGGTGYLMYDKVKRGKIKDSILEKIQSPVIGEEIIFTEQEAKFIEGELKRSVDKELIKIFKKMLEKVQSVYIGEEVVLTVKEAEFLGDLLKCAIDERSKVFKDILKKTQSLFGSPIEAYEWVSKNILEIFKSTKDKPTKQETEYLVEQLKRAIDKERRGMAKCILEKLESDRLVFNEQESELLKYLLLRFEEEGQFMEGQLKK